MFKNSANTVIRNYAKTSIKVSKKLGILGVPFSKGQGNVSISDYGNLKLETHVTSEDNSPYKRIKNYAEFMACNKALIPRISEVLNENDMFLILGGDHSIGFGSVAGHLLHTPNLSLVWVDAHADLNLHSTSYSGNIHGMPVSLLLKELRKYWLQADLYQFAPKCLPADQLVYIGLRDIDPFEDYILNKLNIKAFSMDAIDRFGISKIMEMSLDALKPYNKIHLSFDIDALDMYVAPSTGTPVRGGLTLTEGLYITDALRVTGRLQGIDVAEFNPALGTGDDLESTLNATMRIIRKACADREGKLTGIKENVINLSKELNEK
ncbi:arginase-1 isoform X2 [Glossina fuscipes]|uniref:Arginase n=1 Tax=Glossina fuscipes TaxID=7396 RepID=A0A9C5ZP92_9MUSC|nr:arginase-1 isoform X2 [Glossina fuscipes]